MMLHSPARLADTRLLDKFPIGSHVSEKDADQHHVPLCVDQTAGIGLSYDSQRRAGRNRQDAQTELVIGKNADNGRPQPIFGHRRH